MDSTAETVYKCRAIITRRNASEVLLLPQSAGWALPQVEVQPHRRHAEQLTTGVRKEWGLTSYCLIPLRLQDNEQNQCTGCTVLEAVESNGRAPQGAHWMPRAVAARCCEGRDASAIAELLTEMDTYAQSENAGHFARPGWLRELFLWAQTQATSLGFRLTGGFQQLNASPTFSLVRLETNDRALWFKATGKPNTHELSIATALARSFPQFVPEIVAVHKEWNGWLSLEAPGAPLDETRDLSSWTRAAETLAELQIASVGKTKALVEAGAKDLRSCNLTGEIHPFLSRMSELMAAQEKPSPAPLTESELGTLGERIKESCELLQSLDIPDTLGHIDFNPGNILVSQDSCVFLDWAEAAVTNPTVTFEYLREHLRSCEFKEPSAGERLAAAYLGPWKAVCRTEEMQRALMVSPLLAVFVYAVASQSWRSTDIAGDRKLAGYFRSLTRRMYREVVRVEQGSELCLG